MEYSIAVGPVLIPGVLLAALGALSAARLVLYRFHASHPREVKWVLDRGAVSLFAAFFAWKLWPLIPWWSQILEDPVILLRLPGGRGGLIAGAVVAFALLLPGIIRDGARRIPAAAAGIALIVGFFLTSSLVGALLAPEGPGQSQVSSTLTAEFLSGETGQLVGTDTPTVITFWASWCGPCRAELPVKKRFYEEHGGNVRFVSVNMTRTEQSLRVVRRYVADHDIDYPVALDPGGTLTDRFAIRGTPTTVVLDSAGSVTARWTGPSSLDRLERAVASSQQSP